VILVIAEHQRGALTRSTWEALAAAQAFAAGTSITVAVLGADLDGLAGELAGVQLDRVLRVDSPDLAAYTADGYVAALEQVLAGTGARLVLLPHTYQTRDFAPRLAARLQGAIITDVIELRGTPDAPVAVRPMFQGKLVAEVRPAQPGPVLMTLQVGAFRADSLTRGAGAAIDQVAVTLAPGTIRQRPESPFQEARQAVDLSQAERIVSVGRGIKSQDNMAIVETLAAALGAELAASRPICDNGWLPMERQIGSSGQTVAPKLYVAVGISGAIQHLVGMKGSRTIVAINKDADAPIFEVADYGIVGDLFEVAPAIVAALDPSKRG
jgi:electron transfer flavoprotein alpha subunit